MLFSVDLTRVLLGLRLRPRQSISSQSKKQQNSFSAKSCQLCFFALPFRAYPALARTASGRSCPPIQTRLNNPSRTSVPTGRSDGGVEYHWRPNRNGKSMSRAKRCGPTPSQSNERGGRCCPNRNPASAHRAMFSFCRADRELTSINGGDFDR